jgi:tetratricopeptide (TPR) repeat protein
VGPQTLVRSILAVLMSLAAACAQRAGTVDSTAAMPEGIRVAIDQGVAAMYRRDHDEALRRFTALLDIEPSNPVIHLRLGDVYFRMARYADAVREYDTVLAAAPEDHEARSGWWAARLQQGGYGDEAKARVRAEVDAWLGAAPRRATRRLAAYNGYDSLHDDAAARRVLLSLLHDPPGGKDGEGVAAEAFEAALGESDPEARRQLVDAALSAYPDSVYRHLLYQYHVGWLARARPQDEFRREARRLLRRDPDNRSLNFAVGYWSIELGTDVEWAVGRVRRALAALDHPDVREKLPYVTMARWRRVLDEARGRYEDALGWGLFRLGRMPEAGEAFDRAEQQLPRDHRLAYHRGQWLEAQGRDADALASYRLSMETGAQVADARVAFTRLAVKSGAITEDDPAPWRRFARDAGVTTFTDVTDEAGLNGVTGGRVAWGDYDGDGAEDLIVDGRRLFHNDGRGRFSETTQQAGLAANAGGNGAVWADVNNDGRLDLFTMGNGQPGVEGSEGRVWINRGEGAFDAPDGMVPANLAHGAPTEAAAWGDADRDGFVDLYVADYEAPFDHAVSLGICAPDHLLRNRGGTRFEDVSAAAGIVSAEPMCGRGVAWGDYDNDGFPDILVANYRLDPNFLWRNRGDGTFENTARQAGVEGEEQEGAFGHSIGAEWADVNRDGRLDVFIANLAHPRYIGYSDVSQWLVNAGGSPPRFEDHFDDAGLLFEETASEPAWGDYDNDGDLDLFVTAIYKGRRSALYRNDGNGRFTDVTWLAGAGVANGWGAAYADVDGDGDLDLVVGSTDGVRLLRNDGNANHWVHVKPVGTVSNRSAIGARVTVAAGPLTQTAEVQGGKGTGNQHSLPVEFGLGTWDKPVSVTVRFPSGRVWHGTTKPDRLVKVTEPAEASR